MIHHMRLLENISIADCTRKLVEFLTTWEPKTGRMWNIEWFADPESGTEGGEFPAEPFAYILRKDLTNDPLGQKLYVKIVASKEWIKVIASSEHDPATDNNNLLVLTGSSMTAEESASCNVFVCNKTAGVDDNPNTPEPSASGRYSGILLDQSLDKDTLLLSKVWMIRQLDPLFDEVGERRNTDIYFWLTVCTHEEGADPISRRGWYHHVTAGISGEVLVPDATDAGGAGTYIACGTHSDDTALEASALKRCFAGSAGAPDHPGVVGAAICAGDVDGNKTWFIPGTMYGYGRSPFDEDMFGPWPCVGFDYTELCKYSPYSGVRILTSAYTYGYYDNLWRILSRLPFFYTDMAGLYAGDTIAQIVDNEVTSYAIFPFVNYRCAGSTEAKRGYAIYVPNDEDV